MDDVKKEMNVLAFIRDHCGDRIKIKESELGRALQPSDIPRCFGILFSRESSECAVCILPPACEKWAEVASPREGKRRPRRVTTRKEASRGNKGSKGNKEKRGFIAEKIREMLTAGTTRKDVLKFLDKVGRGHRQFEYMLWKYRKEGKILQKEDGTLVLKTD